MALSWIVDGRSQDVCFDLIFASEGGANKQTRTTAGITSISESNAMI